MNSHDAIESVNNFGLESSQQIVTMFGQLISPKVIQQRLKKALLNELDTKSDSYDPIAFKIMLENFVSKIDLPIFDIQLGDTTNLISSNFSGKITNSDEMQQLINQLAQSLTQVLQQLQSEFERQFAMVIKLLKQAEESLSSDLTANIHQQLDDLQQQIANKKAEIQKYQSLLMDIEEEKQDIADKLHVI